ncbi:MAG: hypothetical protein KBF99_18505 [Leptospiraceae bacterium]|nr:hypothetical protein [Leptospiraceae bacterium]MBK9503340.1 hypothetical protein [Leptospiraceae bacterium]MBL0266112.1 hypothetical protein [Leptospiraceae bacterium]MBP9165179.1 hypothetical protein [Leptospiraceae bacterium]HRG46891.1 hypothetical protein [Leptospiraceae bacterium]
MNSKKIDIKDFLLGFLTCLCLLLLTSISGCGRTLSRLGLGDQKLNLPKDFKSMVSVSLHKDSTGDTVKDLTYETLEGKFRSVEYRDKIWHLEGGIVWEQDK